MTGQPSKKFDLITDLVYLRKGRGLTADRMFIASTLQEVCGGEQPVEITQARLVSAIQSLPEPQSRDALLAAYGLLPVTQGLPSLDARRAAYGRQITRKRDTLADREDAAIKELALRLLASYYAGAPLPAQLPPLPHGGYLIDYLNVTTVYRDRQFLEHQQERRIVSLVDGAPGFRYHSSDTDSSGRTRLLAVEGCTVETEYVPGGSLHLLRFPMPLEYGDVHDFTFRESLEDPETQVDTPLSDFVGQSFETPALIYRQEVTFLGNRPPVIWAYDKLSRVERPGTPEKNELLRFENSGTLRKEFNQPYGGLFCGIAWQWGAIESA
jgi:hypothetical protein